MRSMKAALVVATTAVLVGSVAALAAPNGPGLASCGPAGRSRDHPDVYYLGKRNANGVEVEGHRGRAPRRSRLAPIESPAVGARCFTYLASGAKWLSAEPWSVDASDAPISGMANLMATDVATWENAAAATSSATGRAARATTPTRRTSTVATGPSSARSPMRA